MASCFIAIVHSNSLSWDCRFRSARESYPELKRFLHYSLDLPIGLYILGCTNIIMGTTSSCVYNINYHLIWCPKYRKPILAEPKVKTFLEDQMHTIADAKEYEILELQVMPDHIHLFISAKPFDAPTDIIKVFKGVTALRLFKKFPELRGQFWKGKLWS
ncbi:MAG: IS200/IS605 family transposase, partial [Nitrososphaeraceae archaeon]|nr:IS200/IS605 family transposase [Nitrososphaeraceae archaeon]